jgi:hypothetical protein
MLREAKHLGDDFDVQFKPETLRFAHAYKSAFISEPTP